MSIKSDNEGLVRVKEHIVYGKGVEDLVTAIRKIFAESKWPQKIVMEAGVPHIYVEKMVDQSDVKERETVDLANKTVHDVIRNSKMEEYEMSEASDTTPLKQLFEMFFMVKSEGLEVCHIAVGDRLKFQKWLGVRIPQNNLNLLGTPITVTGELPDDVFVVCGGPARNADPYEIGYSVKATV